MSSTCILRVSILPGETDEHAGRPQGSPLHVGVHEDGGETLAVSLFPTLAIVQENAFAVLLVLFCELFVQNRL